MIFFHVRNSLFSVPLVLPNSFSFGLQEHGAAPATPSAPVLPVPPEPTQAVAAELDDEDAKALREMMAEATPVATHSDALKVRGQNPWLPNCLRSPFLILFGHSPLNYQLTSVI